MLLLAAAGCAKDSKTACTTLGRAGGMVQSYDTVLSIALQPEALDEDVRFCITPSDEPPAVFAQAYLVEPPLSLNYDAIVSYRGELPQDLTDTNVGRISDKDFKAGRGRWISLADCRIEPEARHVRCTDTVVSKFYGLLDDLRTDDSDTIADGTTDDSASASDPTTATMTTMGSESSDTGTGPTPIDYPPECDDLAQPPFDVVFVGPMFEPNVAPPGGAEDLAPDGQGGFVARSGTALVRLDVTGATVGVAEDPGFVVAPLLDAPNFANTSTLGLRYASNGDLMMIQRETNMLQAVHPDGSVDTVAMGLNYPNAVYAGTDGLVWYSEYLAGRVNRYDPASGQNELIAEIMEANGVLHDPLRSMLFYVNYTPGELWRVPIDPTGAPGTATMVADLDGFSDGLAMDVCGNLYVVDEGGPGAIPSRIDRVFMSDAGELQDVQEIAGGLDGEIANANFGFGAAYGDFQTTMFLVGLPGEVYYLDVGITGAPVPVLDMPPPVEGDTDGGDSSSSG